MNALLDGYKSVHNSIPQCGTLVIVNDKNIVTQFYRPQKNTDPFVWCMVTFGNCLQINSVACVSYCSFLTFTIGLN